MGKQDRSVFGWPLRFASHHIDISVLEELRQKFDDVGDDCLVALCESQEGIDSFISNIADTADRAGSTYKDERMQAFIGEVCTVPEWVDWIKIRRGQEVFIQNHAFAVMALLYFSLIGGFAAPKITKVLEATQYLTKSCAATWRRLNETFEMVVDCIDDPKALEIGGKGWRSVLRVRFLHCRVRLRLLGRMQPYPPSLVDHEAAQYDSTHARMSDMPCPVLNNARALPTTTPTHGAAAAWDVAEYGVPLNQEDMMATLCSFSANVLDVINRMSMIPLSRDDEEAYLHLWRYIGHLIGVKDECNVCTDVLRAKGATESVVLHLLHPNSLSRKVAQHLVRTVSDCSPATRWTYRTHCEMARAMLGDPLADALGMDRGSLLQRLYVRWVVLGLLRVLSAVVSPWCVPGSNMYQGIVKVMRLRISSALKRQATSKLSD